MYLRLLRAAIFVKVFQSPAREAQKPLNGNWLNEACLQGHL